MTCPKCHGEMRQYERSGVTIDQCTECRGIYLDRGELEKLFDAEANWNQQRSGAQHQPSHVPGPPPGSGYVPPPPPAQPGYATHGRDQHGYPPAPGYGGQQHYGYHGHYKHKKHKGFLNELFD